MALPNIINEINTIKSTYYTTSGGYLKNGSAIWMGDDDTWKSLDLHSPSGGASLHLRGGNSTNQPYSFVLSTSYEYDDDRRKMLYGDNTGALIWAGNNVITSAGGTINGSLHLSDVGTLYIGKGDWAYPALVSNTNSGFYAISGNSPNQAGEFICRANKDNSNFIDLNGCPDGALYWNRKPVMSIIYEAGGIITYSNGLTFQWGSSSGSTTVNFPQPFAGYPVVYTTNNAVIDSSCNSTTYVTGIAPTYFTTYKIRGNSSNQVQDGGQFSWFALGYR